MEQDPDRRGRLASATARLGRVPHSVWTITALHLAVLLLWSQLVPVDQAPDEAGHAALIIRLADDRSYPAYDEFHPRVADIRSSQLHHPGTAIPREPVWLTPEAAPARSDRRTVEDLGGSEPYSHANQLSQHPPLYYALATPVVWLRRAVLGRDQPIERNRLILRLLSVALVAPLPLLAWAAAHRLGASRSTAVTAAILPVGIPQLSHIGSAITNDSLLILLGGVLAVAVAGIVRGDDRSRTALWAGLLAGLALWTKAHAFAFPPWLVLAYAAPLWRDRGRWPRQLRSGALALGTALATGSWWWVRNLVRHGELSPSIIDGAFRPPDGFQPRPSSYLAENLPRFVHRFWGDFGSFVAPLSPALVIAATAITIGCCLLALAPARIERLGPPTGRVRLAALAAVVPLLAALVLVNAWGYYRDSGIPAAVQGRYLFGAVVPLAVLVAAGMTRVAGRGAPWMLLGVAVVLQVDGMRAALRGFWAEPWASIPRTHAAFRAWRPLPEPIGDSVELLVVVLALTTVVVLWRERSADRPPT